MRKTIVALILEKNGLYLVEKRKDDDRNDPCSIVFPGGHVEDGESLEEAIKREAMEELNIQLVNPKEIHIAKYDNINEKQKLHWFTCSEYLGEIKNNVAEELLWIKASDYDMLTYQVGKNALNALNKK